MKTVFCFFDSLFEGSERDTELRCFFLLFEMNKYYYISLPPIWVAVIFRDRRRSCGPSTWALSESTARSESTGTGCNYPGA